MPENSDYRCTYGPVESDTFTDTKAQEGPRFEYLPLGKEEELGEGGGGGGVDAIITFKIYTTPEKYHYSRMDLSNLAR